MGWTCSYEVAVPGLSGRPDIVGVRGRATLVAEVKASMGLALLGQILQHQARAHYLVAVTPYCRTAPAAIDYLRRLGAGWLMVSGEEWGWAVNPVFCHGVRPLWVRHLELEHQTYCEPGSAGGGYWSPFKKTCALLRAFLVTHPGASTREVVDNVAHHYTRAATARSALLAWAQAGKIPGVRLERDGRAFSWHLSSEGRKGWED
jgi:hypothetical protein